jgi:DNA-binding transcriptional regulator LsrR (DeoR family)
LHQLAWPCQKTIARNLGIGQRSIQSSVTVALEFHVIRIEFHDRDAAITAGVPIRATHRTTPKLNVLCPITELGWLQTLLRHQDRSVVIKNGEEHRFK